jgi:SNF2 family DNA or RNA helicase
MQKFKKYLDKTGMDHKKYQYDGVNWIVSNELNSTPTCGIRGGFLADEMGLGKTIMMIGVFLENFVPNTLIIVPPILIDQWYNQIFKTAGHKALVFHGYRKKRTTLQQLLQAKIVITSYANISLSKQQDSLSILHQIKWNRVVFDEAHHLRNSNTRVFYGAKMLRSDIRWLVSGTPIQNKKKDFYNLCSIIGLPKEFYTNCNNLSLLSRSFILKRTKIQVGIEISKIVVNNIIVQWKNSRERQLSECIHANLPFSNVIQQPKNQPVILSDHYNMLTLMLKARQSCILPRLMLLSFQNLVELGYISNFDCYKDAFNYTSKLDAVIESILQNKNNGNGKLIFCHFREEIAEITRRLIHGGVNKVVYIDGTTTKNKRKSILQNKYDVLILQIQTGCEGLNLQDNYNEIYFTSPHWNPAIEEQAIARCHRIGQTKSVLVKRFEMGQFIQDNTLSIDNYVNTVQLNKKNIANEIL